MRSWTELRPGEKAKGSGLSRGADAHRVKLVEWLAAVPRLQNLTAIVTRQGVLHERQERDELVGEAAEEVQLLLLNSHLVHERRGKVTDEMAGDTRADLVVVLHEAANSGRWTRGARSYDRLEGRHADEVLDERLRRGRPGTEVGRGDVSKGATQAA
jgi:hypothetical protein